MRPGLLGDDGIGRVARADRRDDEPFGRMVGFGHDVLRALEVDALEPLVQVHQDPPGRAGRVDREALLGRPRRHPRSPRLRGRVSAVRQGPLQATANGRSTLPNPTSWSNETVAPGATRGVYTTSA